MQIKNIKMTNRDWYLFIGFIVCCLWIAIMVGDMLVHAPKDYSNLNVSQIECRKGIAILPAGNYSTVDIAAIIDLCNNKHE